MGHCTFCQSRSRRKTIRPAERLSSSILFALNLLELVTNHSSVRIPSYHYVTTVLKALTERSGNRQLHARYRAYFPS